jgi:hypothetical protein
MRLVRGFSSLFFKENFAPADKPFMGRLEFTFIIIAASCCLVSTSAAIEEVLDPTMEVAPSTELALSPAPGKCYCPLPYITQKEDPCAACELGRDCAEQTCEYSGRNEKWAKSSADKLIPRPFPIQYADNLPIDLVAQSKCEIGQEKDCSCDSSLFEEPSGNHAGALIVCLQSSSYQCADSACVFKRGDEIFPYPPKYKSNVAQAKKKFTSNFGFTRAEWPACGEQR